MKKNIEWLKKEVNELPLRFLGFSMLKQREEFTVSKDDVLELIDQLDEPEVLSEELPSIPQFVAEWYESEGKRSSWWKWFYMWGRDESRTKLESKTIGWMQDYNEEVFVDIFKCGYKVEEEQKHYVIFPTQVNQAFGGFNLAEENFNYLATDGSDYWFEDTRSDDLSWEERSTFTEQEIKDYDERFWPFRKPVEEMEE